MKRPASKMVTEKRKIARKAPVSKAKPFKKSQKQISGAVPASVTAKPAKTTEKKLKQTGKKLNHYKLSGFTDKDILMTCESFHDPLIFTGSARNEVDSEPQSNLNSVSAPTTGKPSVPASDQVEVPTWRVKPLTARCAFELTEPFDDETFAERHRKLEADEKRRKRWDLERTRQMMVNRRLENSHRDLLGMPSKAKGEITDELPSISSGKQGQTRSSSAPSTNALLKAELERATRCTFRADPFSATHKVHFIEVTDSLPISAFGLPLPAVKRCDFR